MNCSKLLTTEGHLLGTHACRGWAQPCSLCSLHLAAQPGKRGAGQVTERSRRGSPRVSTIPLPTQAASWCLPWAL